jgi:hypothetical protein
MFMGDEIDVHQHPKGRHCQLVQCLDSTLINKELPIHLVVEEG